MKIPLTMVVAVLTLSGCDQVSNQLSDLFSKPSAEKTLVKMSALSSEGKSDKAIEAGETFLAKHTDPSNQVRERLVKLYLDKGSASDALRHMQAMTAVSAPAAGSSSSTPQAPAAAVAPGATSVSVDGASVRVGPSGTEIRAGDAVVKIQK